MDSYLTPEHKWILWAIRVDREKDSQIIELVKHQVNWNSLAQLAINQGVLPLLYYRLKMLECELIPSPILEELKGMFLANARRNLILSKKLTECMNLLESHGITSISHKGLGLAIDAYNDLSMRQITDLDILIHRNDVSFTSKILTEAGYRPSASFKTHEKMMIISDKHCIFSRHDTSYEIHWNFTRWFQAITLDIDRCWKKFRSIKLNGRNVRVLPLEDEVLILCIHGTLHKWENLKWLADIIHLIHTHPELDWQDLLEYSKRIGVSRILLSTLQLTIDLGGVDLSEEIRKEILKDPVSVKIAQQIESDLFKKEQKRGIISGFHLLFRLRERSRDKLLYLLRFGLYSFVIPTELDYVIIDLPYILSWLYCFIHPLRVFFITIPQRLAGQYKD